ncbi:hypothetical protein YC2023_027060 [Brassica napus]
MTKNRAQLYFQLPLMELKSLKNRAQVVNKLSFVELKSSSKTLILIEHERPSREELVGKLLGSLLSGDHQLDDDARTNPQPEVFKVNEIVIFVGKVEVEVGKEGNNHCCFTRRRDLRREQLLREELRMRPRHSSPLVSSPLDLMTWSRSPPFRVWCRRRDYPGGNDEGQGDVKDGIVHGAWFGWREGIFNMF